ncbi:MAG: mechanosensitive ion channel family protein [Rubrobacteraceae bacterium]
MNPLLVALLQETTGGKTGALEKAGDGAKNVTEQTGSQLGRVGDFFTGFYEYLTSTEFVANVISTIFVAALGVAIYVALAWGVPLVVRWRGGPGDEPLDEEAIARRKRQDTAITLIRNALRYVIFAIVVLFALSIFLRNPLPATAGATILAAVLGFGAQSFLRDVIAGFSIVFEDQYSVGDFIQITPPQGVSGIVEELGLRVTKIRALSGEVHYVPNGMIQGVTNYVSGEQRFTIEIQVSDSEAAQRVLDSLGDTPNLYLRQPRVIGRDETAERVRLRVRAGVLPSMDWLVEENLVERIKAAAREECLVSEPLIYTVDQASLRRIRSLIPHEESRKK